MTQALQTLLDHAENERNQALSLLLQAEEAARRLQQQTLQLLAYRDEYGQRDPGRGGQACGIEQLRTHHGFMQRLEQALLQQQGQTALARERVTASRARLLALETRVASVRKLMQRRAAEARLLAERADQRRTDDAALSQRGRSADLAFAAPAAALPATP